MAAGISSHPRGPRAFRHAFATRLLAAGHSLKAIADLRLSTPRSTIGPWPRSRPPGRRCCDEGDVDRVRQPVGGALPSLRRTSADLGQNLLLAGPAAATFRPLPRATLSGRGPGCAGSDPLRRFVRASAPALSREPSGRGLAGAGACGPRSSSPSSSVIWSENGISVPTPYSGSRGSRRGGSALGDPREGAPARQRAQGEGRSALGRDGPPPAALARHACFRPRGRVRLCSSTRGENG